MGNDPSSENKDHAQECIDLFSGPPDLEAFNHDLLSKKKISISYANILFGGSVAEATPSNFKKDKNHIKMNPLPEEIK
tara:strand:- start:425 stop:658 length:234 start_codon:yes stop_codon:yes gene_type:complete